MDAGEFWSVGDYALVGELWAQPGRDLAASLDVVGRRVIDLATGTGVTAIAMAGLGAASVTGVDAAPKLLAEAARRSDARELEVEWLEADMTAVPLPDGSADIVVSTFGLIFAADPTAAIVESRRLCRPGGRIVFTSWAGPGLFGQLRQALSPYFPDTPEPWHESRRGIRSVVGADAEIVERSFGLTVASAEAFVSQLERQNPPFILGAQALGDRWHQARAELIDVVAAAGERHEDSLHARVSYLVTTLTPT